MKTTKELSIGQIICAAAKEGFRSGRNRARKEAEHNRQLRADARRIAKAERDARQCK